VSKPEFEGVVDSDDASTPVICMTKSCVFFLFLVCASGPVRSNDEQVGVAQHGPDTRGLE